MIIRPIEDTDVEATITLWQSCGLTRPWNDPRNDIEFAKGKANSEILVGQRDGEIVSAVMVGHDGHRGAIYYLAVAPAHQGQGFGRMIHIAAAKWLHGKGVWKVNLMVRSENVSVAKFYEKLGYSQNSVISLGKLITPEESST